jgi:hypothetical protein
MGPYAWQYKAMGLFCIVCSWPDPSFSKKDKTVDAQTHFVVGEVPVHVHSLEGGAWAPEAMNPKGVAYDNYDNFQHVNYVFSQIFISLF